jgi:putative ABC transport system substrate-binding protein
MLVLEDPVLLGTKQETIELLAKARLPAIYGVRDYAEAGGLVSYETDQRQMGRRAAAHNDKIPKKARRSSSPQNSSSSSILKLRRRSALRFAIAAREPRLASRR